MKKIWKFCLAIIGSLIITSCTACQTSYDEAVVKETTTEEALCGNYFEIITKWDDSFANYWIVYAKDTKVKYFITRSGYKFGITPLYNTDGSLQVYGE